MNSFRFLLSLILVSFVTVSTDEPVRKRARTMNASRPIEGSNKFKGLPTNLGSKWVSKKIVQRKVDKATKAKEAQ